MKKKWLLVLSLLLLQLTACGQAPELGTQQSPATTNQTAEDTDVIKTELLTVQLSKQWKYREKEQSIYNEKNEKIGGFQQLGYYPAETFNQPTIDGLVGILPNHADVIKTKMIDGVGGKVIQVNVEISPPAASNETKISRQAHFFYIFEKDKVVYDAHNFLQKHVLEILFHRI